MLWEGKMHALNVEGLFYRKTFFPKPWPKMSNYYKLDRFLSQYKNYILLSGRPYGVRTDWYEVVCKLCLNSGNDGYHGKSNIKDLIKCINNHLA